MDGNSKLIHLFIKQKFNYDLLDQKNKNTCFKGTKINQKHLRVKLK